MMVLTAACGGGGVEAGEYTIKRIQFSDGFCQKSPGQACVSATKGFKVMRVTLRGTRRPVAADSVDCNDPAIRVQASDGSETDCDAQWGKFAVDEGSILFDQYDEVDLFFSVPISARDFTIFLPDAPPTKLGR
jgi:hypothetical protein